MTVVGLVLAAGAGARMGGPKALVRAADGAPWVRRAVEVLRAGGCARVVVVLGASAPEARALVPDGAEIVVAPDWRQGQSASLRAGLGALGAEEAVVITLVDLVDLSAEVVRRVADGAGTRTLARASYDGRPGHPVVLGRDHWATVAEQASGDTGARAYLAAHPTRLVECRDLATGADQDRPASGRHPPQ